MAGSLRIGIVCYPTIGGSGIVATELGFLLAADGHEVHFISYERPVRLGTGRANLFFHPVVVNEYSLFKYPDYTLPLSVRISEVCQEFDLDVLHVHYAVPHATAALLARLMLGEARKPAVITTLHGTDTNLLGKDPHYRPIIKYSIENSCGVTTVSESLKRQTIETFDVAHPIEVIPNFFKPSPPKQSREAIRTMLRVKEEEILLLHMSNLRPVKRVGDLLEAVAGLRNRERVKMVVLAGADFGFWQAEAERLGIGGRVVFQENVEEIHDYLNACDLGVYASEQESFGLGILETLAYGKPVVATRVGGVPEVVCDDETGLLVPVADPAALGVAIDRLVGDPELRGRMGKAAGLDAARRFDPVKVRDQYLRYYRSRIRPQPRILPISDENTLTR